MSTILWVAGYFILAISVTAVIEIATKRLWLLAFASATLTALVAQLIAYAYLGYFDTQAYIIIVPSWVIALLSAIAYWAVVKRIRGS
jgi:hypothetical protein